MCSEEAPRNRIWGRWRVDSDGFLRSDTGAPVARVGPGCLLLYDKREHCQVPFTYEDWQRLFEPPDAEQP